MNRSLRTFAIVSSLGLCTAASGTLAQAADPMHPLKGAPKARAHETSGLIQLVGEALNEVKLDPKQRDAIEKLGKDVKAADAPVVKAKRGLAVALSDQLEKGHVSRKAVEPEIDAYVEARTKASPVLRSAFSELHEILRPDQRSEFVKALDKRIGDEARSETSQKFLDQWAKDLHLTAAQRKELSDDFDKMRPARDQDRNQTVAILKAFEGPSFSIEKIAPERDVAARAKEHADRMVTVAEDLARVLNPDQRTTAANKLREAFGAKSAK